MHNDNPNIYIKDSGENDSKHQKLGERPALRFLHGGMWWMEVREPWLIGSVAFETPLTWPPFSSLCKRFAGIPSTLLLRPNSNVEEF